MKKTFFFFRLAFLVIFFTSLTIIGVSLGRQNDGMSPILIIEGILVGLSSAGYIALGLIERQYGAFLDLFEQNRVLRGHVKHLVELNDSMRSAFAPELPAMPDRPSGRVH